jgi:purine-binding chemotaxis protein CheW
MNLTQTATALTPYLIFNLHGLLYGVDALCVQEIFYLPELTPAPEAPADIVGVVNFRGKILPVMDLDRRFGRPSPGYCLSDSVIVLAWGGVAIGVIVNETHEVKLINPAAVEGQLSYGRVRDSHSRFVTGVAKVDAAIIMLLHLENLVQYSGAMAGETAGIVTDGLIPVTSEFEITSTAESRFCPNATAQERAVFRERAENLMRLTESQNFTGLMPLAVVGLNGEYFGIDLEAVREFTDIRRITPIPCCPSHVVGNINLRGEIVTLIDIRSLLNMPLSNTDTAAKVMVAAVKDLVAGIVVDEVFDVMYLHPSAIKSTPTAVSSSKDEYLRGTAPYRGTMMSILDLSKLLTQGDLVVQEEV